MSIVLVLSTAPDADTAQSLAETLVNEGLAACVNIIPGVQSVYRWQGAVEHAAELILLLKTTQSSYAALETRLRQLHPYELPEILNLGSPDGLPAYLAWIAANSGPFAEKKP